MNKPQHIAAIGLLSLACAATAAAAQPWADIYLNLNDSRPSNSNTAKYIFYFIGDGMASPQIHATEAYLAALEEDDAEAGSVKAKQLFMSQFPVQGMQMSYANNRLITGSAAAGTALACGKKTNIGVIAMDPEAAAPYTTLAEQAKAQGMKVGIVSSVSIDHATPAVFYAHQPSRNNYEEIGASLLASPFDYFAGGGFRVNKWSDDHGATDAERYAWLENEANANGFVFADTRAEFDSIGGDAPSNTRAIAINPYRDGSNAIPYALNRMNSDAYADSITLAEFTAKGIELLDNRRGFFMMVEGGKIDWAAHANDARAAIEDTIAFDNAIKVALDFAEEHPRETLIVVTGDHECGGMTLGFAGTAYDTYFEVLDGQKLAYDDFDRTVFGPYKESHETAPVDIDAEMWAIIEEYFGLDGIGLTTATEDDLTDYERSLLEAAFDKAMGNGSVNTADEDSLLYGYYNPLSVTLTHLLNRRAGLAWTSYSHTAVPVPVMAQGPGETIFDGYYDNTEVARKIASIMRVELDD